MTHGVTTILKRLWKRNNYKKIFKVTRIDEDIRILTSAEYEEGTLSDKVTCRDACRIGDTSMVYYFQWRV